VGHQHALLQAGWQVVGWQVCPISMGGEEMHTQVWHVLSGLGAAYPVAVVQPAGQQRQL
jgi:hypothetical protein